VIPNYRLGPGPGPGPGSGSNDLRTFLSQEIGTSNHLCISFFVSCAFAISLDYFLGPEAG